MLTKEDKKIFTVSQYLDLVNVVLATDKPEIVGEVQEFRVRGQWVGFTLRDKEETAVLKCVLGIWQFKKIGVAIEDGMQLKVSGVAKVTKAYGSFSLWVDTIEPLGEGSLKKAYELLVKQFTAEGLFARKRALPEFVERIAVVSSRDGVVIHDLRKNLKPLGYKIDFYHSQVEGASAADDLVRVFSRIAKRPEYDVLVVIRGGGSLESMQAFNNEAVCRALYASSVPVVVGIGHDVDVPIACLVADASGSTPTQVAHILNASWDELVLGLPQLESQTLIGFERMLERARSHIALRSHTIDNYFKRLFDRFKLLSQKLSTNLAMIYHRIETARERVKNIERLLVAANPMRNLKLGYSIISNSSGKVVKSVDDVTLGEVIINRISDGSFQSEIKKLDTSR